jgi:hypothetical protein
MQKAFSIEWIKLKSHPIYPILIGITLLLYILIVTSNVSKSLNSGSNFSADEALESLGYMQRGTILQSLSYTAGFFKYIFVIIFMMYISLDSRYKMYRKQTMEGWSRDASFFSKYIWIIVFVVVKLLCIYLLGFAMGVKGNESWAAYLHYPLLWAVEFGILMSLGLLIIQLGKSSGVSLVILLLYSLIVEPLISYKFDFLHAILPLKQSRLLIEAPFKKHLAGFIGGDYASAGFPTQALVTSLVFIALFTIVSRMRFVRSDL